MNPNLLETHHTRKEAAPIRQPLVALLIPLAFALGILVGYLVWGHGANQAVAAASIPAGQQADAALTPQSTQQVKRYPVPTGDNPALGPADAPITLIEFSDYQCPYCKKWHTDVYHRLLQEYPTKIRFVYRDFPLDFHAEAMPAAEAARCAGEQGKYWEYHDKLFDSELNSALYTQIAQELGLDMAKFQDCQNSHRYQSVVKANLDYAANLGVNSTPTFFLNGLPLVGAQPYDVFKMVVDKELAGEIPK